MIKKWTKGMILRLKTVCAFGEVTKNAVTIEIECSEDHHDDDCS